VQNATRKKLKMVVYLQLLTSALLLHSLQSSPEVGFVERVVYPLLGSLEQFLHQCQVSLPDFWRYSTVFITSFSFANLCCKSLLFNIDGGRLNINICEQ
jgi:hypothetical protein